MRNQFVNPITLSFDILDGYRHLLQDNLERNNLSAEEIQTILETIQVDRGLFFSLNRKYLESSKSFPQFCRDNDLSADLHSCFPYLGRLYAHQEKAIHSILEGTTTIISTGTGSGKTETFLVPVVDYCLKNSAPGVKALIIYPMNALANDQLRRLSKALQNTEIEFGIFVGSTPENISSELIEPFGPNHLVYRDDIRSNPPDILITNYVMLDWMLSRPKDLTIFQHSAGTLKYIVLDEIHTYRGNKATHVKYLLARLKTNLKEPLVQIGTSATLRRGHTTNGYLKVETNELVDAFINPLLDVETYQLVEPEFSQEETIDPIPIPNAVFHAQNELNWSMSPDSEDGLRMVGLLTGTPYTMMDLDDEGLTKINQQVRQNLFVDKIHQALTNQAQSFSDLVRQLSTLAPGDQELHNPEQIVKAYLSAISFLNHQSKSIPPVLDYRIHLFLKNIGGYLKMCIKCHCYHSGSQDFCQDCGFPLFLVARKDIKKCIGKVSGNHLKWELDPESDDRKNTYYVLIEIQEKENAEALSFDHEAQVTTDEMILNYDPFGRLRLTLLEDIDHNTVYEEGIQLLDIKEDHEYLYQLVKSLLTALPPREKKVLGFVDNREKATQYGLVIKHSFAHDFFLEFLKFHYPEERNLDLENTWQYLSGLKPEEDSSSDLENEVFKDFQLWYFNFVKTPIRDQVNKQEYLVLKFDENYSPIERDVLNVFIRERSIQRVYKNNQPEKFIRFRTYHASHLKGIRLSSEDQSVLRDYPSISLGKDGREYSEIINKYSPERIKEVILELVAKGVLVEGQTRDGKTHYYIHPNQICFALPPSEFKSYYDLKQSLLLTADVHSSEIKDETRKIIEKKFQENTLNFVMATPTLEMGIDIGNLQTVLMVGVPPLPSNYAQRAGRAGRKLGNHLALLLTFCFEYSNHDSYYFQFPERMIEGVISPPTFNPLNKEVISKHFNAYMLSGIPTTRQHLSNFLNQEKTVLAEKLQTSQKIFHLDKTTADQLHEKFLDQLNKEILKSKQDNLQIQFYENGFFPDYAFRRDQIYVVPDNQAVTIRAGIGKPDVTIEDIAISEREPELAYYKFSPDATVFMAGDVYTISTKGKYTEIPLGKQSIGRSYEYFEATKIDGYASRSKYHTKYGLRQLFDNPGTYQEIKGVLGIAYSPNCKILFLNQGIKKLEDVIPFSEDGNDFEIFFKISRRTLILRFDRRISFHQSHYVSLVSALDRTIKDHYGLDDNEIRVLINPKPLDFQHEDNNYIYVLIYDATGNGTVPVGQMANDFMKIIQIAHQKMVSCTGSDQRGCEKGCYACLKSFSLQSYAHLVDKPIAEMFAGYLLGENPFQPSIRPMEGQQSKYDLVFEINLHGTEVRLQGNQMYKTMKEESQNQTFFNLLIQAIHAEFREGMSSLLIRTRLDYLVNAINKGEINRDKESFARLQLNLLRFKQVKAEKI